MLIVALGATSCSEAGEPSGSTTEIVFAMDAEIWVIDSDGGHERQLTDNVRWDGLPAVSPDGRQIAFASNEISYGQIYVMDADGENVQALTPRREGTWDGNPSWSPDGRRIAFSRVTSSPGEIVAAATICVMDGDGGRADPLTIGSEPAWSPDGRRIAFTRDDGVYLMSVDGSGVRRLTAGASDEGPAWSPDGEQIAFSRGWFAGEGADIGAGSEIYVMDADGSNKRRLTHNEVLDNEPAWSRDGAQIAFVHEQSLAIMDVDHVDPVMLISDDGDFWSTPPAHPSWRAVTAER